MKQQETIRLTMEEITNENISVGIQIKVFLLAIPMVFLSILGHCFFFITGFFAIPSTVINIITLGEKTKVAIRRKQNATL